jgi:tetratricopeptide (TPR) repeat protein
LVDAPDPREGRTEPGWQGVGLTLFRDVARREEPAPGPLRAPPAAEYTLRRLLGAGGMGEVWEGVQTALGRLVAVKRLQAENRGGSAEAMFLQEAVITASLDHPNIVPVHDLGRAADGSAILAMKLVRGQSWNDRIRDDFEALPAEELLNRHLPVLVQVAQAVAFAHSRGIVHRDLKPSQVMVGEFGEVLLADWGLAVCLDAPLAPLVHEPPVDLPTLATASSPAGTVAFMAPEQTEATARDVGPWTDVYQLGGILYLLLTGEVPHDGPDPLASARSGVVVPPSERAPGRAVPAELAALCVRALAPRKEERPAAAQEFVAAVGDYLSGAGKRRESIELTRAVRTQIEAGATDYRALAEGSFALVRALGLWPANPEAGALRLRVFETYARAALENGDLVLAQIQAARLDDGEPRRELLAGIEARRRSLERTRAQRRLFLAASLGFLVLLLAGALLYTRDLHRAVARADRARDDAEGLIGFMLGDLRQRLEPVGRLDVLDGAGEQALAYFDRLPPNERTDPVRVRHAQALQQVGSVHWERADVDGAMKLFSQAIETAGPVLQRSPGDPAAVRAVADAEAGLGEGHFTRGRFDEALAHVRRGVSLYEDLARSAPDEPGRLHGELDARALLGRVLRIRNEKEAALAVFQKNLERAHRLVELAPRDAAAFGLLATAHDDLGSLLSIRGDLVAGREHMQSSIEASQRAVALDSTPALRRDLAVGHLNYAGALSDEGDASAAAEQARAAAALLGELCRLDPANTQWRLDLGSARTQLAGALVATGQAREARTEAEAALAVVGPLFEAAPHDAQLRRRSAYARLTVGRALRAQGEEAAALRHFSRAAEEIAPLTSGRDDRFALEIHVESLLELGRVEEARPLAERLLRMGGARGGTLRLMQARGLPAR